MCGTFKKVTKKQEKPSIFLFITIKNIYKQKHFLYNDPFQAYYNDKDLVEQQVAEVYDLMHRQLYEFYRDELSEQLLPRCRCGANTYCRCE